MDMIYWDHYYNTTLLINLLIITGLFASLRLFSGTIAHINASDELLKKDNPAFGISLAGATLAMTIMLSGVIYGDLESSRTETVIVLALFGILGIALMAVTRIIFDKITLPDISLRDEIVKGNIAVAIADAGNVLATAIIIRAVMIWVPMYTIGGLTAILGSFAVSQIILTSMTLLRIKVFSFANKDSGLQNELKNGNIALALRFSGQKIGTAFALATAARIVIYEEYEIFSILAVWFLASIGVILIWKALCFVAHRIILFRVDINQEVLEQKNIAVGRIAGSYLRLSRIPDLDSLDWGTCRNASCLPPQTA
jgi:uncharacterized membrane protein YjfL (UPF0719 family)